MGAILLTLFTFVLIIVSLFLILVILMQRSSANASMGSAFGAGLTESTFGAEAGNVLTKATIWTTGAFFMITLGLYLGHMAVAKKKEETSVYSELLKAQAATSVKAAETTTLPEAPPAQPAETSLGTLPVNTTTSDGTPVTVTMPVVPSAEPSTTPATATEPVPAPAGVPPVESTPTDAPAAESTGSSAYPAGESAITP